MNPFPRPLALGHRGSPREARENTLASFALAVHQGADGVELDVQSSRDGVPVIIHDDDMDRVWGLKRSVSGLAWTAIERLTNGGVPSFEQVGAWAAASRAWLNIELKAKGVEEQVAAIIHTMGLRERVVISSFDPAIVRAAGDVDPSLLRFFLSERWDDDARRAFDESGAAGVCLREDGADDVAIADLERRSLPVIVWTVNDAVRARSLYEAGAAGIISDLPAIVARERDALFPA